MAIKNKPQRLFKVASEFNVSTSSIVDSLSDEGFDIDNKPNSKVTPEMYEALDEVYGDDKANSKEHQKAKEEYKNRRSQMRNDRSESVSVDDFLEPLEDEMPLEPQDEEEVEGIKPQDEEGEPESVEEESAEETIAPETGLEPKEKAEEQQKEETEQPEEQESAEKPDETEEAKIEEEKAQEEAEKETKETSEETTDTAEQETVEAKESEEEEKEKVSAEQEEKDTEAAEEEQEEQKVEDTKEETTDTEEEEKKEEQKGEDEDKEKGVIRGKAGRLKGTKVVGNVKVDDSKPKRRKKRKRKKDRKDKGKKDSSKKKSKKKKKKGKKKRKRRSRIDEQDVEQKMKETLQEMESSETVGSKRQKRRRQRKKAREEEKKKQAEQEEEDKIIEATEFITVSEIADKMNVKANDVITTCMNLGMMASINQRLDASSIETIAEKYDYLVEFVDADEGLEEIELEEDDPEDLQPRAPIITVMGHVDHGKTSLLDYIRKSQVAEGEAGGITQQVGAYEVEAGDGRPITFLDTPGHEAFTAMRSRGAQATDIVILVVAADDAVKPQTIEAINHSKAADVSIIVAINKMDLPGANPDKIKQQLAEHDVLVEEYGGTNQSAEVSAKTGDGIPDLLDKVLIESELMELQANPDRRADGVVLESRVDKGKGIVSNVLVQNGTLSVGDSFVAGPCFGRVRAMENEHGNRMESAGPSETMQLMGFDDMPQAGDKLVVLEDEQRAKEIVNQRQQIRREQEMRQSKHLSLDDLSRQMALGEVEDLNLIVKADVEGSIEAISGEMQKLSNEEISVNVIHTGAGAITESDVLLASASEAIIIGFQVRPTSTARSVADEEEIDIRLFNVIYDAVEEVKDAMEGMLSPEISEKLNGNAEVREIFKVSSVGTIAGCYVTDGEINRNDPVRVVRDGVVIYDGEIDSLKRYKEDVKQVQTGYECGISIVGYDDIKVDDVIENYEMVEEKRKLEDVQSEG